MGHKRKLLKDYCRKFLPGYSKLERLDNKVNQLLKSFPEDKRLDLIPYYSMLFELGTEIGICQTKRTPPLIVSLTTIPERIHKVYLTIECLLRQSIKPNRIILWLDEGNFSSFSIPDALQRQKERGLTIDFCRNIFSYKKLIPTLQKYPDAVIVTCDDDAFYPRDWLVKLYDAYLEDNRHVYCHRAHKMTFDQEQLRPYQEWEYEVENFHDPSFLTFSTGVGGVLYFPGCFDQEIFNEERFLDLCPNADDVWFKTMTIRMGIKTKIIPNRVLLDQGDIWENIYTIPHTQEKALYKKNYLQKEIDIQLRNTFAYFQIDKDTLCL